MGIPINTRQWDDERILRETRCFEELKKLLALLGELLTLGRKLNEKFADIRTRTLALLDRVKAAQSMEEKGVLCGPARGLQAELDIDIQGLLKNYEGKITGIMLSMNNPVFDPVREHVKKVKDETKVTSDQVLSCQVKIKALSTDLHEAIEDVQRQVRAI